MVESHTQDYNSRQSVGKPGDAGEEGAQGGRLRHENVPGTESDTIHPANALSGLNDFGQPMALGSWLAAKIDARVPGSLGRRGRTTAGGSGFGRASRYD